MLSLLRTATALSLLWLATGPSLAGTQHCEGALQRNPADFVPLANGAQLQDNKTQLIWQRCIEDQRWTGTVCQAQDAEAVNPGPGLTYAEALKRASALSNATERWRLPTKAELLTLREPGCYNPSMNLALFPTAPAWSSDGAFWTSTPEASGQALVSAIGRSDAWAATAPSAVYHLRLVRAVPNARR